MKTITEFKLWKDNKKANEFTISISDAAKKFIASDFYYWYTEGARLDRSILNFITAPESEGGGCNRLTTRQRQKKY